MKYDWEDLDFEFACEAAQESMPEEHFFVLGILVENASTGEAAIIPHPDVPLGGVLMADNWKDILGDATRLYSEAVERIFDEEAAE